MKIRIWGILFYLFVLEILFKKSETFYLKVKQYLIQLQYLRFLGSDFFPQAFIEDLMTLIIREFPYNHFGSEKIFLENYWATWQQWGSYSLGTPLLKSFTLTFKRLSFLSVDYFPFSG